MLTIQEKPLSTTQPVHPQQPRPRPLTPSQKRSGHFQRFSVPLERNIDLQNLPSPESATPPNPGPAHTLNLGSNCQGEAETVRQHSGKTSPSPLWLSRLAHGGRSLTLLADQKQNEAKPGTAETHWIWDQESPVILKGEL